MCNRSGKRREVVIGTKRGREVVIGVVTIFLNFAFIPSRLKYCYSNRNFIKSFLNAEFHLCTQVNICSKRRRAERSFIETSCKFRQLYAGGGPLESKKERLICWRITRSLFTTAAFFRIMPFLMLVFYTSLTACLNHYL